MTVAVLLGTAVAAGWAGPEGCASPPAPRHAPTRPAAPAGDATPEPTIPVARPESGDLAVPRGLIGVPVRLTDQVVTGLLRPGDRVSLFAVGVSGGPASPIAADAVVLAVTAAGDIGADGGLLVGLRPAEAKRALGTPQRTGFAVAVTASR